MTENLVFLPIVMLCVQATDLFSNKLLQHVLVLRSVIPPDILGLPAYPQALTP